MCKLWVSEAYRTLVDRIKDKDDRRIFNMEIQNLARQHFTLIGSQTLPSKLGRPYFSHMCEPQIAEVHYHEIEKIKHLKPLIDSLVSEYNDTNRQARLSVPMFDYMIEQTVKINRAI